MDMIIPNMGITKLNFEDVLFNKAQQGLLFLLFGKPDLDFHTNEIIRLPSVGTGAVQRELKKFLTSGIIKMKQAGNQKRYQANREAPLFEELRGIVLKTFGLADVLREALMPLIKHIQFAFIYGSIPRHEDTITSDIDLMVIAEDLTYADLFSILIEPEKLLGRKINPTFYTPARWLQKKDEGNNFIKTVMMRPKIFLKGEEDGLNKLR